MNSAVTHTFVRVPVKDAIIKEVARILLDAGYAHAIKKNKNGKPVLIDMHGMALSAANSKPE